MYGENGYFAFLVYLVGSAFFSVFLVNVILVWAKLSHCTDAKCVGILKISFTATTSDKNLTRNYENMFSSRIIMKPWYPNAMVQEQY